MKESDQQDLETACDNLITYLCKNIPCFECPIYGKYSGECPVETIARIVNNLEDEA